MFNLLLDELRKRKGNETLNDIAIDLLFRASEHGYSSDKFHEFCDEKGATITIIHNEYDHVLGGFASKSWLGGDQQNEQITDPHAFLFALRPKIQTYHFKENRKNGVRALWMYPKFGPVFGKGADLWIKDKCDTNGENGVMCDGSSSFQFDAKEMSGCTKVPSTDSRLRFKIK